MDPSEDDIYWRNKDIPWLVGIFEKKDEDPTELEFIRVGMLLTSTLVLVAGNLNFTLALTKYVVFGGLLRNYNIRVDDVANFPYTVSSEIDLIDYADPTITGPDHFGMAALRLKKEFNNKLSTLDYISTELFRNNPNNDKEFVVADFLNLPIVANLYRIGGFFNDTGEFRYFYADITQGLFHDDNSTVEDGDPCIIHNNLVAVKSKGIGAADWNLGIIGLIEGDNYDPKNLIEKDITFDLPFCPENRYGDYIAFVNPIKKYKDFFDKILSTGGISTSGIILICAGVILFIVISVILSVKLWNYKIKKLQKAVIEEFMLGGEETDLDYFAQFPYDKKDEIETEALTIYEDKTLGSGAFGQVFKGQLVIDENITDVAVKTSLSHLDPGQLKAILIEIKSFQYLGPHPNIIQFIGAITKGISKGHVSIILEYANLGSLLDYLRNNRDQVESPIVINNLNYINLGYDTNIETLYGKTSNLDKIERSDMVKWSQEIACGMSYLESKRLIHGDLAARNLLLTADKTIKLTDFGLSRKLYHYDLYSSKEIACMPWRHMAVECLRYYTFSSKSDVYSYGITIWEMFSFGQTPFAGLEWSSDFVKSLENGLRLEKPSESTDIIYDLMQSCWENAPSYRPTFSEILELLNANEI